MAYPTKIRAVRFLTFLLLAGAAFPAWAQDEQSCTHTYRDENGDDICAAGWKQIPERYRATAQPVDPRGSDPEEKQSLPWADGAEDARDPLSTIYRYRNESGRESFTNIWDQVPTASRENAEVVDLSRVSLNTEVGREIDARLQEQHKALLGSDYCRLALKQQRDRWWSKVWSEFKPLVVVAAIIVLLLLATPFALRRISAPQWARTLTMSIQVLSLLGLFVFAVMKMADAYQTVRTVTAPCRGESWQETSGKPDTLVRRVDLIRQLQQRIRDFEREGVFNTEDGRSIR